MPGVRSDQRRRLRSADLSDLAGGALQAQGIPANSSSAGGGHAPVPPLARQERPQQQAPPEVHHGERGRRLPDDCAEADKEQDGKLCHLHVQDGPREVRGLVPGEVEVRLPRHRVGCLRPGPEPRQSRPQHAAEPAVREGGAHGSPVCGVEMGQHTERPPADERGHAARAAERRARRLPAGEPADGGPHRTGQAPGGQPVRRPVQEQAAEVARAEVRLCPEFQFEGDGGLC
mmetsp:Transcript_3104/g.8418  ORF Transcript_3104/g.8418 Transcript_3104/m.8418 type:complete len:231 (+) Transcript_3104:542-1234(+)